jgi:hypothetical protein
MRGCFKNSNQQSAISKKDAEHTEERGQIFIFFRIFPRIPRPYAASQLKEFVTFSCAMDATKVHEQLFLYCEGGMGMAFCFHQALCFSKAFRLQR